MVDEALAETGNVILNGCLGSMANMLQQSLKMSLPGVRRGDSRVLFPDLVDEPTDNAVLFLYINFSIRDRQIRGYISLLMDLPSLGKLKHLIGDFIARVVAGTE